MVSANEGKNVCVCEKKGATGQGLRATKRFLLPSCRKEVIVWASILWRNAHSIHHLQRSIAT